MTRQVSGNMTIPLGCRHGNNTIITTIKVRKDRGRSLKKDVGSLCFDFLTMNRHKGLQP